MLRRERNHYLRPQPLEESLTSVGDLAVEPLGLVFGVDVGEEVAEGFACLATLELAEELDLFDGF